MQKIKQRSDTGQKEIFALYSRESTNRKHQEKLLPPN
jgi:hypothetical protein